MLRPGGVCGIIVSNRFMTTRSGCTVRERLLDRFDVLHVWDFGDTKLFEAAVLPAVLLLRKKDGRPPVTPKFSSIYSTAQVAQYRCATVFDALRENGVVAVNGKRYLVRHGELDHGNRSDGVWKIATVESDEWLATVRAHTFCTFGDLGKIRVGVKTTADKVFIRDDWESLPEEERPELLRPLITHFVAQRYRARVTQRPKRVLYTHELRDGERRVVDLAQYPRAARYLERHCSIWERGNTRADCRKTLRAQNHIDRKFKSIPRRTFRMKLPYRKAVVKRLESPVASWSGRNSGFMCRLRASEPRY